MEALYAIGALVFVMGLWLGSLKFYGRRKPNATAEDAGCFALCVMLVAVALLVIVGTVLSPDTSNCKAQANNCALEQGK